ncbi:MAG: hypothetical protein V3S47_01510 [Acidobacteriota bacterium]
MSAWIVQLERAWLRFVLPGAGEPTWILVVLSAEEEPTGTAADTSEEEGRTSVILEDGAPF